MKPKKANIQNLWNRVVSEDDMKSFESLFYLLNEPLIQFCNMYVKQTEVAEDIVSDVFFNCYNKRKNLGDIQRIDTYLFVAVKNQSLNYLKKFSHINLVQIEQANEFEFLNTYNPQEEIETKELMFKLNQVIENLPQQCRIIFKLIKEDDLQYKEVAQILEISPSTVKNQLYRAMQKLYTALSEYNPAQIRGRRNG